MSKKHPKENKTAPSIRQAQQATTSLSKSTDSQKDNVTKYLVLGMVVFVLVVGVLATVLQGGSKPSSTPKGANSKAGYAISYKATTKNAPTINLWEDFQCPSCLRYEQTNGAYLASLINAGKINANFHMLSFLGTESVDAANASACAADQGKFLEFHSFLYAHQGAEQSGAFSNANLVGFGAAIGISDPAFTTCVQTGKYKSWVDGVAANGVKSKINSTPTIFLNGKELSLQKVVYDAKAFAKAVGL